MGEFSLIGWTHSTWNAWIGCTMFEEECANCYAQATDERRFSKTLPGCSAAKPVPHWGKGAPRYQTSQATFEAPLYWNKFPFVCGTCGHAASPLAKVGNRTDFPCAASKCEGYYERRRVFTGSLMDWADEEVPDEWRDKLFDVADRCTEINFLLLTKRIDNALRYLTARYPDGLPFHFWMGLSYMRRRPSDVLTLEKVRARIRFLSAEPLLGEFILPQTSGIHWAIFGGESVERGAKKPARPCRVEWIYNAVQLCRQRQIAPFVKQLGSNVTCYNYNLFDWPDCTATEALGQGAVECRILLNDRKGTTPKEWPEQVRVQELPVAFSLLCQQ